VFKGAEQVTRYILKKVNQKKLGPMIHLNTMILKGIIDEPLKQFIYGDLMYNYL